MKWQNFFRAIQKKKKKKEKKKKEKKTNGQTGEDLPDPPRYHSLG